MSDAHLVVADVPVTQWRVVDPSQSGDGSWIIEGYGAVFGQRTRLWNGRSFVVTEQIQQGAFRDALARVNLTDPVERTLVHLNYGHDMMSAVASTDAPGPIGRLALREDQTGLWFSSRVAADDPDVQRMVAKMRHGIVRQASFAFTVDKETVTYGTADDGRDLEDVTIEKVRDLFDVCVCPQGAYPQTESFVRSIHAAYVGRSPVVGEGQQRRPDDVSGGVIDVAPVVGVVDDTARRRLAQAKAAAKARTTHITRSR